jgi:serine protease
MMTQDSESIPFGISVTKGDSTIIPASRGSPSACSNPDSFKVAIIDSGVDVGHPDIPCLPIDDPYTNCKGVSIGIDGQSWYAPKGKAGHGTHAFGTIGAIGGNGEGVAGMVPNSDGICYLIGRVFDDEGNGQYASNVFEAIDWAISEKADVINISSSGPAMYVTGQLSFYMAYANGDLTVASAGNRGSDAPQYPASFDHVLSVAAVKDDGERAYFSQYNDKVDVAAPGVDILSTTFHGRYATTSGTSMAAPYITGAIAKVWSICGDCSNIQVRECLLTTASSSSDRTNELGFSIVSADKTYDCLVNIVGCCGEDVSTGAIVDPRVEQLPAQGIDPELSWETLATTGCTRRAAVVKNASAVEEWESVRR